MTGLPASYSNTNVAFFLSSFGSNAIVSTGLISTTGNLAGGNIIGGNVYWGSNILSGTGNIFSNRIFFSTEIYGGTPGFTATANITGGNVLSSSIVSAAGNIIAGSGGGNFFVGNVVGNSVSATGTITGSNVSATNHIGTAVSVSGNVTGGNLSTAGNITGGNIATVGNVNITSTGRLVATGIEFTNYSWTSVATSGGTTALPGGINNMKRVWVFTGTQNQTVSTPLTTFNTVVPEFYIINKSTGTLFIQDTVGFDLVTVPSGASCTLTAILTSTTGTSSWRAALSASGYALGCGGQTWQNVLASRAIGTNYTNSTGRPIMVCVSANSFNASCNMTTVVDGVTTNINRVSDYYTPDYVTPSPQTTSFIVPNGVVYNVGQINGTVNLQSWAELR